MHASVRTAGQARSLLAIAVASLFTAPAFAQFSPAGPVISTTVGAQTLSANTGTINVGGAISVSGGTLGLNMTGTSTLINNGTIQTTGTGRAIDSNSGIANLNVVNTGLISSVSSDAFRVNTNSAVSLTNSGTIRVINGGQAIDWAAITSKANTLTNQATGIISSVGEDAVRPGTNGVVINAGTITATPIVSAGSASGSDGIDVRTFSGISVTNSGTITGRHGIATDGANTGPSTLTVNNNSGGNITANNGSGINIDGVSASVTANVVNQVGATIKGGVLAGTTAADGDGIDVDGVLTITNSGNVLGLGAKGLGSDGGANNVEAIAAGGGSITNTATGVIRGDSNVANGDVTRAGNGILIDNSSGGSAVAATTVINSGIIQGMSGFGVKMVGTFADTITNEAGGVIQGAGVGAAIQTGDGADIVTNRGIIIGANGSALDLQGGNDTLKIEGGVAGITGNVSGGSGVDTLTFALGSGSNFLYSGLISNFETIALMSGSLTLDGADRISADSVLNLSGGTLNLMNAGAVNGQTFASLLLSGNSAIDLDFTSITFGALDSVGLGKTLSILDYSGSGSPTYALRFFGDYSSNADFLALISGTTINGQAARYEFDGTYTNVTPVPEPESVALLALGGLFLLFVRRRRKAA